MIRLIALLSACIMMLSGCGCANDKNNDGIVGNDQTQNDNVVEHGADNNLTHDDTVVHDDTILNDEGLTNGNATDTTAARSRGIVGSAVDGVGNAVEDIGKGANNVMHDVGNALR